jgi:hypothetical protein
MRHEKEGGKCRILFVRNLSRWSGKAFCEAAYDQFAPPFHRALGAELKLHGTNPIATAASTDISLEKLNPQ